MSKRRINERKEYFINWHFIKASSRTNEKYNPIIIIIMINIINIIIIYIYDLKVDIYLVIFRCSSSVQSVLFSCFRLDR